MNDFLPLLLALSVGFTHAFEADHLVAVSNIVTRRNKLALSLKDGIFWGLGHSSTILLVGGVFLLGRFAVHETNFRYLEAFVGVMLVGLGGWRLYRLAVPQHTPAASWAGTSSVHHHEHPATDHAHKLAYGVGLIHGLAGSGALILSVLTQIRGVGASMLYLILFGLGSVAGMMVAAGMFSLPFLARVQANASLRTALVLISSLCCLLLGIKVLWENLG